MKVILLHLETAVGGMPSRELSRGYACSQRQDELRLCGSGSGRIHPQHKRVMPYVQDFDMKVALRTIDDWHHKRN